MGEVLIRSVKKKKGKKFQEPSFPPRPQECTVRSAPRRAKIICTIGPACNTEADMRDLLRLGMDIARLNFSHDTHEDHARNIQPLRRATDPQTPPLCILQHLQLPTIPTVPLQ